MRAVKSLTSVLAQSRFCVKSSSAEIFPDCFRFWDQIATAQGSQKERLGEELKKPRPQQPVVGEPQQSVLGPEGFSGTLR